MITMIPHKKHQHPTVLWFLATSQAFYCAAIGATTSLLILHFIYTLHMPPDKAYKTFAAMNSLIYLLPLAGGYFGEKLGYVLTIFFGFLGVFFGFILLGIPNPHLILLGIACFSAGNAFVVPNTNALVGLHYPEKSPLRESGYTLYFLIYNIGFLISPVLAGYLSLESDSLVFLISAGSVLIAFIVFLFCINKVDILSEVTFLPQITKSLKVRLFYLAILWLIIFLGTFILLSQKDFDTKVLISLTFIISIGLLLSAKRQKSTSKRLKILAFLGLCILAVIFWSLYMLTPSLLTVFIAQNVNRHIFGLIPTPSYYALDALFVILLGFVFSWFWRYCAERQYKIPLVAKFAVALLCMGVAYFVLSLGIFYSNQNTHLISAYWIVLTYVFIAAGELLISPIGMAMVGILIPKQEGLGMGIWQAFIGLSAIVSGALANHINITPSESILKTNHLYLNAFLRMAGTALLIGIIILVITFIIKKIYSPKLLAKSTIDFLPIQNKKSPAFPVTFS